jgi:hypothetical protein
MIINFYYKINNKNIRDNVMLYIECAIFGILYALPNNLDITHRSYTLFLSLYCFIYFLNISSL